MSDSSRPQGLALVPPPLMFAVPLVIGILLKSRFPLVHPGASAARWLHWLGIGLIAAGIAHTLTSVILFVSNRTTIIPHRHASTFVRRGAYRWTRNPMYVGLTLIYVGICAITTALLALLLLPIPLLLVDRLVIPMEERHMEEAFGTDYSDYKTRVRRWL
jgi:protein-S-isoprenylcysteine O-methyltransferase Ste14